MSPVVKRSEANECGRTIKETFLLTRHEADRRCLCLHVGPHGLPFLEVTDSQKALAYTNNLEQQSSILASDLVK